MRKLLALSFFLAFSCGQQTDKNKSPASANKTEKAYFDTCACFSSAVQLATNYRDPIDLANASKEINDTCRVVLSLENALNKLQQCDEVLIRLEAFDSVKMSEFVQNSRFLLSNITDMP